MILMYVHFATLRRPKHFNNSFCYQTQFWTEASLNNNLNAIMSNLQFGNDKFSSKTQPPHTAMMNRENESMVYKMTNFQTDTTNN